MGARDFTMKILGLCENGSKSWEDIARMALGSMTEDQVIMMGAACGIRNEPEAPVVPVRDPNSPKTGPVHVCITGSLYAGNRGYVVTCATNAGLIVDDAVTSETDYLVTNHPTSGSTKNRKAKELGIPVICEKEFISKFNIKT